MYSNLEKYPENDFRCIVMLLLSFCEETKSLAQHHFRSVFTETPSRECGHLELLSTHTTRTFVLLLPPKILYDMAKLS